MNALAPGDVAGDPSAVPLLEHDTPAGATSRRSAGDPVLSTLRDSELYRRYRGAFEATLGLPLELQRPDAFHFPLNGSRQQNGFCTLMAARNGSCAACLRFQQQLQRTAVDEPRTLECAAGLSESAIPVRVGEVLIGLLRTGQVLHEAPTRRRWGQIRERLGLDAAAPEAGPLEAAYLQTRVVSKLQYQAAISLLRIFAQHLGTLANRLLIEQSNAELPVIARARAFIEQNLTEPLRLADVARAVNVSAFYFCKLFSRATGMTYVQYLARVRIEVAKRKLMNPNLRVCEAAFVTGFQSLSQFNRVFRRIAGETPSAFRERLQVEVCRERRR